MLRAFLVVVAVAALLLTGLRALHARDARLVAQGDAQGAARVQAQWDQASAQAAEQRARDEEAARREEAARARNAERIAYEQARRESSLAARAARADARLRGLLDAIYGLDAADAALLSGARTVTGLAAIAGQARTARQLLGQCASRYRSVAGEADQLRDQVIGLQSFVAQACHGPRDEEAPHDH